MKTRLVSYDIWDTVLRRRCHPDAVKINTANTLLSIAGPAVKFHLRDPFALLHIRQSVEAKIGRRCLRDGWDDEYSLSDVLREWADCVFRPSANCSEQIVGELQRSELRFEKSVVSLDDSILGVFEQDGSTRRIYISDFYMPGTMLEELLDSVGASRFFHGGYVSCDKLLNKRSGRLFDYVRSTEGDFAEWCHYGDNEHSDFVVPQKRGIAARLYLPDIQHNRRLESEAKFSNRGHYINSLLNPPCVLRGARNTSSLVSGLFLGFTLFIQERVLALGLKRLFFLTREGEFFLRIYKTIRRFSPHRSQLPEGELLEVSRLSTFAPSIRDFAIPELMRVWNLYSTQSFTALFETLGFDKDVFTALASNHGIDVDHSIEYPWLDNRVISFFHDPAVKERASREIESKRRSVLDYFQRMIPPVGSDNRVALVDIGWRGTIQDNIATLIPDTTFYGIYLGLNKFLNEQCSNSQKVAFGPNLNDSNSLSRLLRFVAPVEMISNSPHGSVVGYAKIDGQYKAIRHVDACENEVFQCFSADLQDSVVSVVEHLAPEVFSNSIGSYELRPLSMANWESLISEPPDDLVNAYFSLEHNETFGLGRFIEKRWDISKLELLALVVTKEGRRRARAKLSQIGWIEGFLRWRKSFLVSKLVSFIYRGC
jgi:hypothetical protein